MVLKESMLQLFLPLCKFSASICPLGYFHHHIRLHICCQSDTWNTVSGATTLTLHFGENIRELTFQNKEGYKPIYHLLDSIVHCTFSDMHPCNHPCPWLLASMILSFCKLFPSIFPLDRCYRHIRLRICCQQCTSGTVPDWDISGFNCSWHYGLNISFLRSSYSFLRPDM